MNFDNKKHSDDLLEACGLVCYALMAAEGLQPANNQMSEKQFNNCAAGVFGLIAHALNEAHDLLSEAETDFRLSHGLHYPAYSGSTEYTEGAAHE